MNSGLCPWGEQKNYSGQYKFLSLLHCPMSLPLVLAHPYYTRGWPRLLSSAVCMCVWSWQFLCSLAVLELTCRPVRPQVHRSSCLSLCFPSAGIKGVYHCPHHTTVFETWSFIEDGLLVSRTFGCQRAPELRLSLQHPYSHPQSWDSRCALPSLAFMSGLGVQTQVLMLCGNRFTHWATYSAPRFSSKHAQQYCLRNGGALPL